MTRSLSPEESELWGRVTASIRPLSRDPIESKPKPAQVQSEGPTRSAMQKAAAPAQTTPVAAIAPRGPGTTLDGTWDRRLRAGSLQPDRIVDLHGHSLDSAWHAIDRALEAAEAAGDRLVLLVTGHHRPGEPPVKRGRIRAAVHDWLAVSRHASRIAAVRAAHPRHGGGGSLYIVLRRR